MGSKGAKPLFVTISSLLVTKIQRFVTYSTIRYPERCPITGRLYHLAIHPYYRKIEGYKESATLLKIDSTLSFRSERDACGELTEPPLVIRSSVHATLSALDNKRVTVIGTPNVIRGLQHIHIVVIEQIEAFSP